MREGKSGLYRWLETAGVENVQALNKLLERAVSWKEFKPGAVA